MSPDLIDIARPRLVPVLAAQPSARPGVNYTEVNYYSTAAGTAGRARDGDSELMLRVRDGDHASFESLLRKHRGPMIHHLHRLVRNEAVAEELAQEVFLRVYRSREHYRPSAKFTTWLFRIGTHLALNWIRDGRKEKSHASLDEETVRGAGMQVADGRKTAEQALLYDVKLREVRRAIHSLPAKQRAAVMMHKYRDMEYAGIASTFGCTEAAVKSLLFRAYEALRLRLAHLA
jgi:RNA polymerase sigma-70 factor, ECF subfamily